jgi:NAD(P)-dependent dehydrogenase (short-subunit alcohol dehydrogenase family)
MRLKDEVVMVTGGGSGIGQAACLLFAKEGARVAVGDLVSESAAATSAKIVEAGGWAMHGQVDVTNSSSVEAFVAEVFHQYGRVDVLVNNAGGPITFTTVLDSTEPDWDKTLALNVRSVFLVSRLVLPSMIKNKKGSIINIGSMVGLTGWKNRAAYSAAKGAVIALTRAMAADHGKDGIRVNCICPGVTLTAAVLHSMQPNSAFPNGLDQQTLEQQTPIGRLGKPLDIAEAIVFMASNQASWITGAVLPVDGGVTAT